MHIWFCKMMTINWPSWKWQHMQRYISVIKAMMTLRIKWAKIKVMKISRQWWPRSIGFKLYVRYFKCATTICCLSSLNWPAMRSRRLDIGQVLCCTSMDQDYILGVGRGVFWTSSNRDDQMGAKITIQKKKSLDQQLTPKISHAEFPSLKKFPESITW